MASTTGAALALMLMAFGVEWPSAVLGAALPGPPIFESISHYPSFCYLPPESGLCTSANLTTIADKPANNGEKENHLRLEDYEVGTQQQPAPGQLLTRFYFDSVTAQCYPFGAQLCGGNENRFETQADCLAKCKIN